MEFERGVMTRLTSDPGNDVYPVWSPDGLWIMFSSDRSGGLLQLHKMRVDGTGGEERVLESSTAMIPFSWAPDGLLVYQSRHRLQTGGPSGLNRRGAPPPRRVPNRPGRWPGLAGWPVAGLRSPSRQGNIGPAAIVGRLCAKLPHARSEGARLDEMARPAPGGAGTAASSSSTPGMDGSWPCRSRAMARRLRLARRPRCSSHPSLAVLLRKSVSTQQYDVAKDGRFLLNVPVEPVSDQSFTVVVNWTAGLTR